MSDTVIVALLAMVGTICGSALGVIASYKLVTWWLEQLEKKVNKHNNIIERTYVLEGQMAEVQHDIKDLKAYHKPKPDA